MQTLLEFGTRKDGGVFDDNASTIGNTPLVRLHRVVPNDSVTILAKIEGRNPAYSVKCRLGAALVWDAERRGLLTEGRELIEPTSGNTGIALAYVCATRGLKLTLTMPETMSIERRRLMQQFGANLILTEGAKGMAGAIALARQLAQEQPERYLLLDQFANPANAEIHRLTTGPEIYEATGGKVDVLVAGVGTGGTISGISTYFEVDRNQPLHSVAVEPYESPVITQALAGEPIKPGPHKIQGLGAGFIPGNLDLARVDQVEKVSYDEAIDYARRLARLEGILCGISCGAAMAVAARLAADPAFAGKTMVVVLPDTGERYLSTPLFE
jgi:cysteine synthase